MKWCAVFVTLSLVVGCLPGETGGGGPKPPGPAAGGSGGESSGGAGGGGGTAGAGPASGGTGGAQMPMPPPATGGTGGVAAPDAASTEPARMDAAAVQPDAPRATDLPPAMPPPAPGQGPVAEGQIVFSQDFENGRAGITLSPTNLPESRAMIVDDPLGQRGKVMRMQWLVGDNYRIGQYRPRANISNTGFYYASGDRINYAWGFMTEGTYIGATIAQNITGGDPIWMLRGQANGELDIIPGGGKVPYKLEAKKWYDIRVEINYVGGAAGYADFYINGTKVFSKRGGLFIGPRPHWDGGIYLTSFGQSGEGNSTPRTVYISNLSVGKL